MANRTYLYAADSYPGEVSEDGGVVEVPENLVGVAEWNWEIPPLAELLVSTKPEVCRSTIWDGPFGIVGEFDGGVTRALELLRAITHPGAVDEVSAAVRALESVRRRYLILETAEVFALDDEPIDEQVRDLCERIAGPHSDPLAAARRIDAADPDDLPRLLDEIGLHAFWSEHLYFAPLSAESGSTSTTEAGVPMRETPPEAAAEPTVDGQADPDVDDGEVDRPVHEEHPARGRGRRVVKLIALTAALGVVAFLLVWRVASFSERSGLPWWIIPAGVVAGLVILAVVLVLLSRKTPDLRETVGSHRPHAPAVPGFTTAEMAGWAQRLPHGLVPPKDAGAMVVVVSTESTWEVWTYLVGDGPTWTIRRSPETVVQRRPGTLMGRRTESLVLGDGVSGGGGPDLNFVPSYSGNQLDEQNGSPEWIDRALTDLGASPSGSS